ncbi:globin domain-containing protein [Mobilicoccus caccae]|uniref:nitric oxide dioxygenase n=1 Tax=Mobilicoccus caccae TaxID=1859295 RepID=A0ABQ6IXS2_9MICO|nr:globin domain-containing protein [Mobilicoccus caccae]GMA41489.1 hemin transporter [Mobilicoccus caccae]
MLSQQSTEVVKATAGVVAEHAVEITSRFYPHMFEAHPELLDIFNRADQELGEQAQALAASVVAYAVHLIDPDSPSFEPVLQRIAHKHVSLGITAPQYTIVGHHLMWAIGDVLGDAVTPEIAAAWDEVYWLFALQLVAEEAKLYAQHGLDPENPWRDYRVTDRIDEVGVDESAEVVTFVLAPVDGGEVPAHSAGQYVTVNPVLTDGGTQPRQYTISSGPKSTTLQITVRRVRGVDGAPDGLVSNHLIDNCPEGTVIPVSVPCGDVVLDDSSDPLVLVSAGVGITPMAAIVDDLADRAPKRPVLMVHADASAGRHPLYDTVSASAGRLESVGSHLWYEDLEGAAERGAVEGLMDLTDVEVPENATVFMCGPLPFMRTVRRSLLDKGVSGERIRYEVFGPDLWAQNPN